MLSLVAFLLVACEPPPPPIPGTIERNGAVVKVVNGQNVTQGMIDAQLEQLPANVRDGLVARGQLDKVKDQVIIGELLYQEALKKKLHEDPKVKAGIGFAERNALATALIERTITERSTDDAIKKYYDDHAVAFARPQVKARHILVKDKAEAEKLMAEVKADPSKFSAIATEKSVDKGSAKEGGELGWFEKGRMVAEFADAAFAANKGDIVGPIETKFGFHVIEVEDKRESVPVDEVKDKIKEQLRNEVIEAYIEELKKAATMTDPAGATGGATVTPPAGGAAPAAPDAPATETTPPPAH